MSRKNKILIAVLIVAAIAGSAFYLYSEKRARDLKIVELSARASYLNTTKTLAKIASPHIEKLIQDAEREGMCLIVLYHEFLILCHNDGFFACAGFT